MIAGSHEVSERTLRRWTAEAGQGGRGPGRPGHTQATLEAARGEVEAALHHLGWTVGEPALHRALPWVQRRPLRQALRSLKAQHRAQVLRREEALRVCIEVLHRDVLWCLDGTHLGRVARRGVEAQVLREAATRRTLHLSVGPAATQEDVIALLEHMKNTGRLPLVLGTDNGSAYTGDRVARWLDEHHVTHLRNLPHTPRHNPGVERGIGELKAESGLGSGIELNNPEEAQDRLEAARARLDELRERPCLGGRTALEVDTAMPSAYTSKQREAFFHEVRAALEVAVGGIDGARARRLAQREVVFRSLESRGLIRRTRGGLPFPSPKPDTISC